MHRGFANSFSSHDNTSELAYFYTDLINVSEFSLTGKNNEQILALVNRFFFLLCLLLLFSGIGLAIFTLSFFFSYLICTTIHFLIKI